MDDNVVDTEQEEAVADVGGVSSQKEAAALDDAKAGQSSISIEDLTSSVSARGLGSRVFLKLSADTLRIWYAAVLTMLSDGTLEGSSVGSSALLKRVRERLGTSDRDLTVAELEAMVAEDTEEDNEESSSGEKGSVLSGLLSSVEGLAEAVLPAPVKLVLGLGHTLWGITKVLLWGLVIYGGFRLVKRHGSKVIVGDDGEGFTLEWDYELEREESVSATTAPQVITSAGRSVRATSRELQASEILYERLTGHKAVGGALSSGFYRKNGDIHGAWDLRTPNKTPLYWPYEVEGVVVRANTTPSGGKQLFIHAGGYEVGLAHLDDNEVVPVGTVLKRGDLFAVSGATGRTADGKSYSSHLHINTTELSRVGASYSSSEERRAARTPLEVSMEDLGVSVPDNGSTSVVPTTVGGVGVTQTRLGSPAARRTNNPYSIMSATTKPKYEGAEGVERLSGGRKMVKFDNVRSASRAAALSMLKYQMDHDVSGSGGSWVRLRDIAARYVDGSHSPNATLSSDASRWAKGIASSMGISTQDSIDVREAKTMVLLLRGIAKHESSSEVDDISLAGGVTAAYNSYYNNGWNDQGGLPVFPNLQH